jgi:predicted aminopeptidase
MHLLPIKTIVFLWGLICLAAAYGCQTVDYYTQAIDGQCWILYKRRPISSIVADADSPHNLREKLLFIQKVRQFAEDELQLPVNNHYRTYVDLDRLYVLWNVFATPEFSLTPKEWCYPFAGCAAYRGYFNEKSARHYADKLAQQGYDVYVSGVTAYSTLGWFEDPVLSTFLGFSDDRTAGLIFHELAHQVLYIKGDTVFNESFASSVEQEGLRRWQNILGSERIYTEYESRQRRQKQFVRLIMHYRQKLEVLYQTDLPPVKKRALKATVFSELRHEFNRLKKNQIEFTAYDGWMNQSLNNAKIGSVVAYHHFIPAFQNMLKRNRGEMNQFFADCRQLAKKDIDKRHQFLQSLMTKYEF